MSDTARFALVLLILDYVVGTYLVVLLFREYPVAGSVTTWLSMYFFAVIQPIYVTVLHYRWLNTRGVEWTRALRFFVISPIIAGGLTLVLALDLIHRAVRLAAH